MCRPESISSSNVLDDCLLEARDLSSDLAVSLVWDRGSFEEDLRTLLRAGTLHDRVCQLQRDAEQHDDRRSQTTRNFAAATQGDTAELVRVLQKGLGRPSDTNGRLAGRLLAVAAAMLPAVTGLDTRRSSVTSWPSSLGRVQAGGRSSPTRGGSLSQGCAPLGAEVSRSRESRAVKGKTMSVVKHTAGTGAIATAVGAGLGLPLLGAMMFLAVLLTGGRLLGHQR